MKFVLLLSLLVILALTIDHAKSWGRRRRRGRRRWFKKVLKFGTKVYHGYKKHKPLIKGIWNVAKGWLGRKDSKVFAHLASLKAKDRESYDDFMQQVMATLEDQYPEEDVNQMLEFVDEMVDMQPDELELLFDESDALFASDDDDWFKDLRNDLSDRVANIKDQE